MSPAPNVAPPMASAMAPTTVAAVLGEGLYRGPHGQGKGKKGHSDECAGGATHGDLRYFTPPSPGVSDHHRIALLWLVNDASGCLRGRAQPLTSYLGLPNLLLLPPSSDSWAGTFSPVPLHA